MKEYTWKPWDDGYETQVTDRIRAVTWRFGSIHQCKIFVEYPQSRDPCDGTEIGICLLHRKTLKGARSHVLKWAEKIAAGNFPGPDDLFTRLYLEWPSQFRTRLRVLNHLFFTIGNGFSWLDGCLIDSSPEDILEWTQKQKFRQKKIREGTANLFELECEMMDLEQAALPKGPLPDDGKPIDFYPVCDYSNILCVPDDVRDDWLAVAYEAALALRDRTGETGAYWPESTPELRAKKVTEQKAYGDQVVNELRERFPLRVPTEN
ncbi:MAG: hypothetical protein WC824_13260 [Bacteroidota bacterium]|jgi:hypothetical protein